MPQRILLIQLRQLGDILLTTPCIDAVRRQHPDAQIDFLTHRMGKLILEGLPQLNQLLTYDERDTLSTQLKLLRRLRTNRYDLIFDFMNNPRSALATLATGATQRLAFASARRWFYTQTIPRPSAGDYIVREKFMLLEAGGIQTSSQQLLQPWFADDAATTKNFFTQHPQLRDAPLRVVLSPTHRRPARQWPLERYSALADWLSKEWQACISWAWGPGEESVIDACMRLCTAPTLKMPATSFRGLAAFIGNHDLFIGNSNGPSHLAVANNICSLQLHGPTRASSWCPLNARHQAVESPFSYGDTRRDMQSITLAAVQSQLTAMHSVINDAAHTRSKQPFRETWSMHAP